MEIKSEGRLTAAALAPSGRRAEIVITEYDRLLELDQESAAYQRAVKDRPGIISGITRYAGIIGKSMAHMAEDVKAEETYSFEHQGKVHFMADGREVGVCNARADNFRLTIHEFAISESERGKGYGKEALKAALEYGSRVGKVPVFEVCHLSQAFEFLDSQGFDIYYYPEDPDDYAYVVPPGHAELMRKSHSMSTHRGSSMDSIEEFAELVRERLR